jgi:hypothetical protein
VCESPGGSAAGSDDLSKLNADLMQKFMQRWMRAEIAIAVTLALLGVLWLWHPSGLYLWLKAFHVIAVIAWMAGMLYLPRLFVYHCEAEAGSRQSETFKVNGAAPAARDHQSRHGGDAGCSGCGSPSTAASSRPAGCTASCCWC